MIFEANILSGGARACGCSRVKAAGLTRLLVDHKMQKGGTGDYLEPLLQLHHSREATGMFGSGGRKLLKMGREYFGIVASDCLPANQHVQIPVGQ
jgi:hypothetical protein